MNFLQLKSGYVLFSKTNFLASKDNNQKYVNFYNKCSVNMFLLHLETIQLSDVELKQEFEEVKNMDNEKLQSWSNRLL